MSYLAALGLTLVIEMPVYAGFLRSELSIGARRGAGVGALVNLASHPIAFLVVMPLLARPLGFFPALVVIEAGVWVAESALLWLWLRRDLDLLGLAALLANTISLTAGLLLLIL